MTTQKRMFAGNVRSPELRFRSSRMRAMALVQSLMSISVMLMMSSLVVDVGMYYSAKSELQRNADAAALAAGAVIEQGASTAWTEAVRFAISDDIAGQKLTSGAVSMQTGTWSNSQFTVGGTPSNAVRVTVKRSESTGNPLKLFFGPMCGINSVSLSATAIARMKPQASKYNIVGIDKADFSGVGVLSKVTGRIVSNGNVNIGVPLGLLVGVDGEARSYGGITKKGTLASITGSTAKLTEVLTYPSASLPIKTSNTAIQSYLNASNDFIATGSAIIPAGSYHVRDLNLIAALNMRLEGEVTFYVDRNFNMAAAANLLGNSSFDPGMFKIRVLPGGSVNFLAPLLTPVNMDLYAPDSDITIAVGVGNFYGRLIGKTLNIAAPVASNYTECTTLPDPNAASALSIVR